MKTYILYVMGKILDMSSFSLDRYKGECDNVEATLKALFINAKPLLKDFPVALF